VASGSDKELSTFAATEVEKGIHEKFADLQRKRNFRTVDLAAGRAYVASYVSFVHYVEGLHQAVEGKAAGHYADGEPAQATHHESGD